MGTRAIICFDKGKKGVLAVHVLYDGYMEGLGSTLLRKYSKCNEAKSLFKLGTVLEGVNGNLEKLLWTNVNQSEIHIDGFTSIVQEGSPYKVESITKLCEDDAGASYIYLYNTARNCWYSVDYGYDGDRVTNITLNPLTYENTGVNTKDKIHELSLTSIPVYMVYKDELAMYGIQCNANVRQYASNSVVGKRGVQAVINRFEAGLSFDEKKRMGIYADIPHLFMAQRCYNINCLAPRKVKGNTLKSLSEICADLQIPRIDHGDTFVSVVSTVLKRQCTHVTLIDAPLYVHELRDMGLMQLLCVCDRDKKDVKYEWYWRLDIPEFEWASDKVFDNWHSIDTIWTKAEIATYLKQISKRQAANGGVITIK